MLNKAMLIGRITKDLELRKSPQNISVVNFSLACDSGKSGSPDYINCVAWRQSADFLADYCGKGDLVYVEGAIKTRSYENKAKQKVYVTEVQCSEVKLLAKKKAAGEVQTSPEESAESEYDPDYDLAEEQRKFL